MESPARGAYGVFPGSFNPPTVAHLAIAQQARAVHGLERVDMTISVVTLAKERDPALAPVGERQALLQALAAERPWLGVQVTDAQLLADIAQGYDVLVLGADKWAQLQDPHFYGGSAKARDEALARLPKLAVAARPPHPLPAEHALAVPEWIRDISATAVRSGRSEWHALSRQARSLADRTNSGVAGPE